MNYLDDDNQAQLKAQLNQYLADKAKRRAGTNNSATYEGLEDQIENQKSTSDIGALLGTLSQTASGAGSIDGKQSKSLVPEFVDRITASGNNALNNYRGVRDMEERSNMNDLNVANYLSAIDTKQDTKNYRDKAFQSNEDYRNKVYENALKKRSLNPNVVSQRGEPVTLDAEGNPETLPGYKLRDRSQMENAGTWVSAPNGKGLINKKTGATRDLPLNFQSKDKADKPEVDKGLRDLESSYIKKGGEAASIANFIEAQTKGVEDALSRKDQKQALALANGMIKSLNSLQGSDAVGKEEKERLAYLLENIRANPFSGAMGIGPDISGFVGQARNTAKALRTGAKANMSDAQSLKSGVSPIDVVGGSSPTPETVRIQSPDGEVQTIRADKAQKYIDMGGKVVP